MATINRINKLYLDDWHTPVIQNYFQKAIFKRTA